MWKRAGTLKSQGWRATCVIFSRTWLGVGRGTGISWRISLRPFEEPWTIAVLVVGRGSIVKKWGCVMAGRFGIVGVEEGNLATKGREVVLKERRKRC